MSECVGVCVVRALHYAMVVCGRVRVSVWSVVCVSVFGIYTYTLNYVVVRDIVWF